MALPKNRSTVSFGMDSTKVKIKEINLISDPEIVTQQWGDKEIETVYDIEIVYSNKGGEWKTANKQQLTVKNLSKKCKLVEMNGFTLVQWNGYKMDLVPILMLYRKAGNEVPTRDFDINGLEGFEFQAIIREGISKKTQKPYKFIDWTETLSENGIELPEANADMYDPQELLVTDEAFDKLDDKKTETAKTVEDISDDDLPF